MLRIDPNAAKGLNKLSSDIITLSQYYQKRTPKTNLNEPTYKVRFSFVDFVKVAIYSVFTVAIIKYLILILHW